MSAFAYRRQVLHAEDAPLPRIAERVGTPFYCYSTATLSGRYRAFREALTGLDATVCYALKANSTQAVIKTLAALGAGADVVSEGELARALAAGVPPARIVFAGVGKTAGEMEAGLAAGILQFNVESMAELEALDQTARRLGQRAPTAIRVNPNVDARTHAKIATGTTETKFGIDLDHAADAAKVAAAMPGIDFLGLAVHIGSQLTETTPFRVAFERVVGLALALRGAGIPIRRLDLGGGLGVDYGEGTAPRLDDYARIVRETTAPLACPLIFEPGRALVAEAGVLVTRVLYVKRGASRTFVIVDAAMNDFIRPTLYGAHHAIVPVAEPAVEAEAHRVDLVGPVCETGDMFAEQRPLPPLAPGDLLAILGTGAYGSVMASSYNTRPPAAEVMVNGADVAVVRPRRSVAELIAEDRLPDWLSGTETEAAVAARPRRR